MDEEFFENQNLPELGEKESGEVRKILSAGVKEILDRLKEIADSATDYPTVAEFRMNYRWDAGEPVTKRMGGFVVTVRHPTQTDECKPFSEISVLDAWIPELDTARIDAALRMNVKDAARRLADIHGINEGEVCP